MLLGASPNGTAEYIPLKCLRLNYDNNMNLLQTAYQNLSIPYQITIQSTKYKWECTFSHLKKTYTSRCGSIVGIYDGNRSGYLFSSGGTDTFQVCVGGNHFGTCFDLNSDEKNTITAEYDGSGKTYSIKDTLGRIGTTAISDNWQNGGNYPINKQFNLTSCATYNSYEDSRAEFVAMKFYELKIWEWQNGAYTLKVDMIPVKMKSGDTWVPGVYDVVTGTFQNKPSFGTSDFAFEENTTKITFDSQGATTPGTTELSFSPGTTLMPITPPTKTGCTFDGYYTGTNGTGTKYYDENGKSIATSTSTSDFTLYANWIHNHSFKYAVDGNKIYAYCDNAANKEQCSYYAQDATTAKAKSGIPTVEININGGAYTGSAYTASTSQTYDFASVTGTSIGSISYKKKDGTVLSGAPKDAGDYTASVSVVSYTLSKDFSISKINQSGVTTSMDNYTYAQTTLPTPSINNAKENPSIKYYYSTTNQTTGGTEWLGMTSQTLPFGTYYMYAVLDSTINYNGFTTPAVPFTVSKATRNVSTSVSDWTYGQSGDVPSPSLNVTSLPENPTITYYYNTTNSSTDGTLWSSITDTTTLNAGDYYIYAVISETDSYSEYITAATPFIVKKSTDYTVTPPTGKITYGQKLSEAVLEGGSASKQGDFGWKDTVKDEKPQVSDSELTEYDMVFTPSGDDVINYAPVTVKTKVIVAPKKVNPEINDIKLVDQDGTITVTETIKELDLGVALTGETDYEREVVKEPEKTGDTSTNYTITYKFKGNYTGTTTKKVSVPKNQKQGDNIISTAKSDPKAEEEYNPEIKPVSYDDAKKVINTEIEKVAEDSSSEQHENAKAIVEKIQGEGDSAITYDAELSVEMKALESVPEDEEPVILAEARKIPRVNEDIRYVDISVYLTYTAQIGSNEDTKVTQSRQQIHDLSNIDVKETITMDVPADMRIVPSGYDRTYYVIRAHKNTDETIETSIIAQTKSTTITITSNKFSTYALAYSDSLKPEEPEEPSGGSSNGNSTAVTPPVAVKPAAVGYASPKTGDTKELYVLIGLLIIGVAVFVSGSRKKIR